MENINLAEIYEALKQHEAALRELTASVGAITAFLKGSDPFGKIQTDQAQALAASLHTFESAVQRYDEQIRKARKD